MRNSFAEWSRLNNSEDYPTLFRTPWFSIKNRKGFFTLEYGEPQVAILPIVDGYSVLLIRVRRPLIEDEPWELPAGGCERNETTLEAARREFSEETGVYIKETHRFKELPALSELPGRSPELLVCYRIDITEAEFNNRKQNTDQEITKIALFNFENLKEKIINGEIYLSSAIAVLARFLLQKDKQR